MRAGAEWHRPFFKHSGTVLFCLTDSADGAAGQTGRTVPECLLSDSFIRGECGGILRWMKEDVRWMTVDG